MKKVLLLTTMVWLLCFNINESYAQTVAGRGTVTYVNVAPAGFAFSVNGVPSPCPAISTQFYVLWTLQSANQVYSEVMASYEFGDTVGIVSGQCQSNTAFSSGQVYIVSGVDTQH